MLRDKIRVAEPPADPGTRAIAQCLGSQNGGDGRLETLKPRQGPKEFISLGDVETGLCETGLCDKSLGCLVI